MSIGTEEIINVMYRYIDYVLNTLNSLNIPIIHGEDNGPAPVDDNAENPDPYVVIHLLAQNPGGRGEEVSETDINGITDYRQRYEGTVSIEEVNGYGDALNYIKEYKRHGNVMTKLKELGLSILRFENITPAPTLEENIWTRRHVMDIIIAYTDITHENTSWIETVNTNPTYL
jgi:hypothetical protein